MVKSGAPVSANEKLTRALRAGGEDLLRFRTLTQKTPIQPLQISSASAVVDHILVSPGDKIALLADDQGRAAIACAALRPHWDVANWVPDTKALLRVQSLHPNSNVHFDKQPDPRGMADIKAVLAVGWAHHVFSRTQYSLAQLAIAVQKLIAGLPDNGQLLIQDVGLGDDSHRFVLLDVSNSEAVDALLEFSQTARSNLSPEERGFFIEVLRAPKIGVTRFRLPYRWAAEFFQRWRLGVAPDAPYEVTTLPLEQWAGMVEQCGGRVLYRAPHALKQHEAQKFFDVMRFLDERERILPYPPSAFTLVIEKLTDEKAAGLYERRVVKEAVRDLRITADKNGTLVEIASQENDVLPWRRDEDGNLRVWVRTHVPRPIINTVPRGTPNLDGRQWAGYLIEPMTVAAQTTIDAEFVAQAVSSWTRLPMMSIKSVRAGIHYYPAPNYLAQRISGLFVQVTNSLPLQNDTDIVEVLANDVLRALSAGLIPDGKLEILITKLMTDLGIRPTSTGDLLNAPEFQPVKIKTTAQRDARTSRGPIAKSGKNLNEYVAQETDMIRGVRSVFVQDHISAYGRESRNATEKDFIIPAALSANTAVCLPLVRNVVGQYVFAAEPQSLPIPQRLGASEPMLSLPSFRLPEDLKSLDDVRAFLAKHLGVASEDLFPLGPSFFLQPDISPERIYPFALNASGLATRWERWYKPGGQLQRLIDPHVEKSTAFIEFKAARDLGQFYQGFSPDMAAEVTQKIAAAKIEALQAVQHVVPQPVQQSNDNAWQPILRP